MKHASYILFLFGISILSSCNKYIDTTKSKRETKILDGSFVFYPEQNILTYRSKVGLSKDSEVFYPKSFEVPLPKKLLHYQFSNSQDFYFFYNDNQTVYIKIDLERKSKGLDTLITPTKQEIAAFIKDNNFSQRDRYNINKIEFDDARKQMLIKRGAATILLYNIKEKNQDIFLKKLDEFKFL